MTKKRTFLCPRPKTTNLNRVVSDAIKPITPQKTQTSKNHQFKSGDLVHQSEVSGRWTTGVTSNSIEIRAKSYSSARKDLIQKSLRYIKKKLWERGIDHANIYISYETMCRIADKLAKSESMGSDQKRLNNKVTEQDATSQGQGFGAVCSPSKDPGLERPAKIEWR